MTVLGSFTMPIGNYCLPAVLREREGRRWVSFPPDWGAGLPCEIAAEDIGPDFALKALRFGEKALGRQSGLGGWTWTVASGKTHLQPQSQ